MCTGLSLSAQCHIGRAVHTIWFIEQDGSKLFLVLNAIIRQLFLNNNNNI